MILSEDCPDPGRRRKSVRFVGSAGVAGKKGVVLAPSASNVRYYEGMQLGSRD